MFSKLKEAMIIKSVHYIAYKTQSYKLIIPKAENEENELYALKKDPMEKINIYKTNQNLVLKLESEMISLLREYKKKTESLNIKFTK